MAIDHARGPDGSGPRKTYTYVAEDGSPLFRVIRRPGKKFHQERYVNGTWLSGLGDTPRVLYNLPAVKEAAERGGTVWIPEGEKDADAIVGQGAVATCNPMGAGKNKWHDDYSRALVGCRYAVIVYDNDEEGRQFALDKAASLKRVGVAVRFKRALEGNDVSDHLEAGHSLSELVSERPQGEAISESESEPRVVVSTADPAVYQLALIRLRDYAREHGLALPRESTTGWEACCPSHDDRNASLGVRVGDDHPLVFNCQAGCEWNEIADALGIDHRDVSEHKPPEYDEALEKEIIRQRVRNEASVIIAADGAQSVSPPPTSPEEYMSMEPPAEPYSIDELHIQGANTLVVAAYKTGKSTLAINLYRSLVNGDPFLGKFRVVGHGGRVAYLDYEMLESQFRVWLQAGGDINHDRMVTPWHLRGTVLAFWTKNVRLQLVEWLTSNNVKSLIIDTAARAWAGLVENENSNSEILRFTDALDQLKAEAEVQDLFLITHMGRSSPFMPEGEERSRGATRLEDWMDTGWYLTRNKAGQRYMRANGRGVDMDPMVLEYTPNTRTLTTSGVLKKEADERSGDEQVVDSLMIFTEPPTTSQLKESIPGAAEGRAGKMLGAESRGLIERRQGPGRTKTCHITELGRAIHERRVASSVTESPESAPVEKKRARRRRVSRVKQPETVT